MQDASAAQDLLHELCRDANAAVSAAPVSLHNFQQELSSTAGSARAAAPGASRMFAIVRNGCNRPVTAQIDRVTLPGVRDGAAAFVYSEAEAAETMRRTLRCISVLALLAMASAAAAFVIQMLPDPEVRVLAATCFDEISIACTCLQRGPGNGRGMSRCFWRGASAVAPVHVLRSFAPASSLLLRRADKPQGMRSTVNVVQADRSAGERPTKPTLLLPGAAGTRKGGADWAHRLAPDQLPFCVAPVDLRSLRWHRHTEQQRGGEVQQPLLPRGSDVRDASAA
jgi:hypothetical protein